MTHSLIINIINRAVFLIKSFLRDYKSIQILINQAWNFLWFTHSFLTFERETSANFVTLRTFWNFATCTDLRPFPIVYC